MDPVGITSMKAVFGSPDSSEKPEKSMATVKELKKKLDGLGVEYTSKASKAELEVLALKATRKPVPEDRPPKVPAETARADIKISCMVETLDGKVHEQEFSIVNPGGCIRGTQRNNPAFIFELVRAGLVAKLGRRHIK